ncbi:MAG: glycosyltransferase [Chloroflexi bacterium]|nr:MAG: glycosyltransferase [Chloroflexota bacterium]
MRVLAVVPDLQARGTELYVARVAPALRELEVEVEVCALDHSGPLVAELASAGIRTHGTSFPRWTSRLGSGAVVRTVREIAALARGGRFDLVHSHLFWPDVLASFGGRLAGRRVIQGRRSLHRWRHEALAHLDLLETASNLAAAEVVANSRAVLEDAERGERFLPRRRAVVYNGIDAGRYERARIGTSGRLRLVTVGSLHPLKGQEFALEALASATAEGVDAELTLVGDGPERAALDGLAGRLGLAGRVVFAGEELDPRPRLAAADLFLLPSLTEGFSNALLEAMASGLPVLATDVGGNPEAVVAGEGGRLVPAGDAAALAGALVELDSDRRRLASMGEANRRRLEERFSLRASARALADWYRGG